MGQIIGAIWAIIGTIAGAIIAACIVLIISVYALDLVAEYKEDHPRGVNYKKTKKGSK